MNFKKNFSILIILFILIFSVGVVSASENSDNLTVEGTGSLDSASVYQKEDLDAWIKANKKNTITTGDRNE